ncbi:DUF2169 family type VI secretion system accessory protein [Acetobacter vaccinii]|uniref:DUF2169 domain-containing protein n=1 Tax=Acetobacter vaccinii TaxID=2592655 RepID=A0A5C1YMY9_9PROT|nr:DUF2169 domain-containing protein [Acetobacter vaccinii]QEO16457.1 DUF2169 domain-containing protein [Acetobacter vaccinii]
MLVENDTPLVLKSVDGALGDREQACSIVVKGCFRLVQAGTAVFHSRPPMFMEDTPFRDDIGRSLAWPSDLELFKPNLDFIVLGSFFAPDGLPVSQSMAGFKFGPMEKAVRIVGARQAVRDAGGHWHVTRPEPLQNLPLRWEYSAGGLDDARNPFGLGQDVEGEEGAPSGTGVYHLPMIEGMNDPAWTPDARPQPVNLAPVPPMFEQRRSKLGKRDRRWGLFRAPLPPKDYDPSYTNAAPDGQQAEGEPTGSELLKLYNMHPRHKVLECGLPDFVPYAAVVLRGATRAQPLALRLDTLIVRPDLEEMVLLWRAVVPGAANGNEIAKVVCRGRKRAGPETAQALADELTAQMLKAEAAAKAKAKSDFDKLLSAKLAKAEKTAARNAKLLADAHTDAMQDIQSLLGNEKMPADIRSKLTNLSSVEEMEKAAMEHMEALLAKMEQDYQGLLKSVAEKSEGA